MRLLQKLTCLLNKLKLTLIKFLLNGKTIDLTGDNIVIQSDNFSVDETGKVKATAGEIGGYEITDEYFTSDIYPLKDYTQDDLQKITDYLAGNIELTEEEKIFYDVDGNGEINSLDILSIVRLINSNVTNQEHGKIFINKRDPINTILIVDKDGNAVTRIGLIGIKTNKLETLEPIEKDIVTGKLSKTYTVNSNESYEKIPFDNFISSGSYLSAEDGQIEIASGVSQILVSGKLQLISTGLQTGGKNFVIRKNGEIVARSMFTIANIANTNETITPIVIDVSEGDIIDAAYYGKSGENIAGGVWTYLTIEVVS